MPACSRCPKSDLMQILGHGIDAVLVTRIEGMLHRHGDRFTQRCFTVEERAYCRGRMRSAEHFAVRFAAKEAVLKALGTGLTGGIAWTDVSVHSSASGKPIVRLSGAAERIADSLGITGWQLSLTHTRETAFASAIAIRA